MALPKTTITLPNNTTIEIEGTPTVEQIRDTVSALGVANLAGAPAVESVTATGSRAVRFAEPQGTTKG